MLVYSIGSQQSLDMLRIIRDKILNHLVRSFHRRAHEHITDDSRQGTKWAPITVVGNKADLRPDQRQVSMEKGKALAEEFQCSWVEASARYDENVAKAFENMISEIEKSQNPSEPTGGKSCEVM